MQFMPSVSSSESAPSAAAPATARRFAAAAKRAKSQPATTPLFSEQWFRVSSLRPRLDPQLTASRVTWRGQVWHVLVRPDGQRSLRLNAAAYAFAGRCNGELTVQRLWELLIGEFKDEAPAQDELLQLLVQLKGAGMLLFDRQNGGGPWALRGLGAVTDRSRSSTAATNKPSLLSYRMPLGKPDAVLARLSRFTDPLFSRTALAAWMLVVAMAAVAAIVNADVLVAHARLWTTTPRYLLLAWVLYPLIKALHEVAHGAAIKRWGGQVPEWGITWMMFSPVPYVDASSASSFPRAGRRFVVSAAGIMAELLIASIALFIGLNAEPGWLRDIAFVSFGIATVSTLLVNGNPLLRFDGYHALTDALELPNLDSRSRQWWLQWLRAHVLRATVADPLQPARGERAWLWAYAPAALAWRVVIAFALVGWAGKLSVVLGSALALYFVGGLLLRPALQGVKLLAGESLAVAERRKARRIAAVGVAAFVLAACVVPLPYTSIAQGVVWPAQGSRVVAGTAGFVDELLAHDGEHVVAGQLLMRLSAPQLQVDQAASVERITSLEAERYQSLRADPAQAAALDESLWQAQQEAERIAERVAGLDVRAQAGGTLVLPHEQDLAGRYLQQGAFVAQVLTGGATTVRVAIAQEEAALVTRTLEHPASIEVRLADEPARTYAATLSRDLLAATPALPSAALAEYSGGTIQTDPQDPKHLKPVDGVVLADVVLSGAAGAASTRIGTRAWVRIDHGSAPLAVQLARSAQQLFLKHFNPE
jgi:putative peptide zinc metalloprotease protein